MNANDPSIINGPAMTVEQALAEPTVVDLEAAQVAGAAAHWAAVTGGSFRCHVLETGNPDVDAAGRAVERLQAERAELIRRRKELVDGRRAAEQADLEAHAQAKLAQAQGKRGKQSEDPGDVAQQEHTRQTQAVIRDRSAVDRALSTAIRQYQGAIGEHFGELEHQAVGQVRTAEATCSAVLDQLAAAAEGVELARRQHRWLAQGVTHPVGVSRHPDIAGRAVPVGDVLAALRSALGG